MSQRRGIITDQLTNIIQVIQLGKKTGRLIVERGEGVQHEDGMLYFARGQIVDAWSGSLRKTAAVNWLHTWGKCRFIFETEESKDATAPQPSPLSPTDDTRTHPSLHPMPGNDYQNKVDSQYTGQFSATRVLHRQANSNTVGNLLAAKNLDSPPIPPNTPYRTKQDEVGMYILTRAGFSRIHLRLYLLIDRHRNVVELTRLMGRPAKEVQQYLDDLRRLGIIHY